MDEFECQHQPKTKKLLFSCQVTGNYQIFLCEDCYKKDDKKFLIAQENITISEASKNL
jgi:hypothetical protein